jgi:hypothetical protein
MSYILMEQGEDAFIRCTLQGDVSANGTITGDWGVALATTAVGTNTAANKERVNDVSTGSGKIQEIGQTLASGYGRATVARDNTGWPNPTGHPGASYSSTAPQVSFSFSDAPNANGAASWWLTKTDGGGEGNDDLMMGADLAAVRNFANGDTENVTITYQQT